MTTTTPSSSTTPSKKLNPRDFPRPPLCERTPRKLEIKWGNQTIASTTSAYWVLETFHPPTYYLPPSSIQIPLVKNPQRQSFCEWKGVASYYDVAHPENSQEVVRGRIWSYDAPTGRFAEIRDYLSFYAGPWECFVDGERVVPQPGDFYGGWATAEIEMSQVKGAPGTRHW
jgi:uncharacterized protein (DUF427 family)